MLVEMLLFFIYQIMVFLKTFYQSIEEKMKLYIGSCPYGNNRGYTPITEEKLSPKGDLKEGFDLAMEFSPQDKDRIERRASLYGHNFWLENLRGKY
jgi:isopenicillin N synthase-like dioxygenase